MKLGSAFVLAGLCLVGCGGSGSGGVVNLFAGTWTGPWTAGADKGTATFQITGLNSVAGTITDTTTNQTYQVSGSIETPGTNSTRIDLSESNNGNLVTFSGVITEASNLKSFSGTLTDLASSGDVQTITLTYTGT